MNITKKIKRVLDERHDYIHLNETFNKCVSIVEASNQNTIDAAANYVYNWIEYIEHREGYNVLAKKVYYLLGIIFRTNVYHQNFLNSFEFKIKYLEELIKEKYEILEEYNKEVKERIGFLR